MKPNITLKLTKEVLALSNKPISKVRLAKMVYFSFKELVLEGYYQPEDLAFIRMPLGPVPFGFYDALESDKDIQITIADIGLSYNRESYSLRHAVTVSSQYLSVLTKVVQQLEKYPTSLLVGISHNDASWQKNANGMTYFISKDDLNNFKGLEAAQISEAIDDQLMQSKLIIGMKDEIVKDSSALEYPDHYPSA